MWMVEKWAEYGLSVDSVIFGADRDRAVLCHDLVVCYLERHPEVRARYKGDQSGAVRYLDVLKLAKEEIQDGVERLRALRASLADLIVSEDISDEDLREAAGGLLPEIYDALLKLVPIAAGEAGVVPT